MYSDGPKRPLVCDIAVVLYYQLVFHPNRTVFSPIWWHRQARELRVHMRPPHPKEIEARRIVMEALETLKTSLIDREAD